MLTSGSLDLNWRSPVVQGTLHKDQSLSRRVHSLTKTRCNKYLCQKFKKEWEEGNGKARWLLLSLDSHLKAPKFIGNRESSILSYETHCFAGTLCIFSQLDFYSCVRMKV